MPEGSFVRASRAIAWLKTPDGKRLFRYASVSVVSTAISLGGLTLFFGVLSIGTATECNVLATAIATIPSYYLNRTWAWGKTGRSHVMREVVPFWVIAFLSLVISTVAVKFAAHEAHELTHSHAMITAFVVFANFCTYGLLWVAKFTIFNRLLFVHRPLVAAEESAEGLASVKTR